MAQKQRRRSSATQCGVQCDISEQEAFDYYRGLQTPTLEAVTDHFTQLGRNVNRSTIERWAREGKWHSRIDLGSAFLFLDSDTIRCELAKLALEPIDDIKEGLSHLLFLRMAEQIRHLKVQDVEDLARLYDLALKLGKASTRPRANDDAKPTGAPDLPQ